jgi:hypothetical protein
VNVNGRHEAAVKAWKTRLSPRHKSIVAERGSKEALRLYCEEHGWKVAFFEGKTGAPRTGIIDAVVFRIAKGKPDCLELRLVQLKGGKAGVSGPEIRRLKEAVSQVNVDWLIAAYDGETLHLVPEMK